ncbi:apolipoprotein L4-like [Ursus arctos]|uniref:apolipoprotein L4-like n=1 Tax=Ursus arctos TaxID=9644 RepID=UPI00254946FE|nr:apolipoprotein L4-like [Ursus arctos]XP_057172468.1 apolipoprotein L4-like [Ursus arctos]XP_057172469.1 apolipoprotein L4-like [Ursus arctos]XP_057172470.1 apolipoprotein L4-like [Ursus arctos]
MTSGAHGLSPETEALVEKVIESFQNTVSLQELHILPTDHETWERFVAEATLSREEADALHGGLDRLDMEAEDQLARERFLSEFPQLKMRLEERIRKLLELSGNDDRLHKNCTISKRVGGSTGMSGILKFVGLGLVPFRGQSDTHSSYSGAGSNIRCDPCVHQLRERLKRVVHKCQASHTTSIGIDDKEKVVANVFSEQTSNFFLSRYLH